MSRVSRTTARNDGDFDCILYIVDEIKIETAVASVLVDAVQQDLSGAHDFYRLDELSYIEVATLTSTLDGALVPAVLLAVGARCRRLDGVVLCGVGRGDVDTLGVDADNDCLVAVGGGDGLDCCGACKLLAAGVVLFCGCDGVRTDADFVGARLEVHCCDVEGGDLGSVCVDSVANTTSYRQRYEDGFAGSAQDFEHGCISDGAVAEGGNVEEGDLVGALLVVLLRHVDWLAQVAHSSIGILLSHIVLVALCNHQIAVVVRSHVETCDDSPCQAFLGLGC